MRDLVRQFNNAAKTIGTGCRQPGNWVAHSELTLFFINAAFFASNPKQGIFNGLAAIAMGAFALKNYYRAGKKAQSDDTPPPPQP